MPGDIVVDRLPGEPDADPPAFMTGLTEHLAHSQELARDHLKGAQ